VWTARSVPTDTHTTANVKRTVPHASDLASTRVNATEPERNVPNVVCIFGIPIASTTTSDSQDARVPSPFVSVSNFAPAADGTTANTNTSVFRNSNLPNNREPAFAATVYTTPNIRTFVLCRNTFLQVCILIEQSCKLMHCVLDNPKPILYTFFDCETTQDTGKHHVNYIVSHSQCAGCMDAGVPFDSLPAPNLSYTCVCPPVKKMHFENFDNHKKSPLEQFIGFVLQRRKKQKVRHVCIAHNSSRFDTHLVFETAVNMGYTPKMVQNGLKVYK
jgi:hypothetical protein